MAMFQSYATKGFTMIRGLRRLLFVVLSVGVLCASAAYADSFRLRLEDLGTGTGVVVTDGGAGDFNSLAGAITYSGPVNSFVVNVTTGISKPVIGGVNSYAELDLNSINVQVAYAGTLRITLEDSGYTLGPYGELSAVGAVGGTLIAMAGSTATFQSWVNPDNLVPDLGPSVSYPGVLPSIGATPAKSVAVWSDGPVTFGPGAFSSTDSESFVHSGPYALFTQATLNFTGPGIVSFDQHLSTVPEPTSLLLLGSGLAGLGLWGRRKKKSAQV
jgi:hypothetical protein